MITKSIETAIDTTTFPSGIIPRFLGGSSGPQQINVTSALLMLGSIAIPNGLSAASPARFWAWVRYFTAISTSPDLRIIPAFADLDPHQKAILSDDFGVAFSVQWLFDSLGGFVDIVDGRRFLLQYSSLMSKIVKGKSAKVGGGKCPDFVILDHKGKWHVLECKGTQSNTTYRDEQLRIALSQKTVIDIKPTIRGQRLAAGLYIGNDLDNTSSHMKIVDPETEPYIELENEEIGETALHRLALSRAFGLAGFAHVGEELSLPTTRNEQYSEFYFPEEMKRSSKPFEERLEAARDRDRELHKNEIRFEEGSVEFTGRQTRIEIPGVEFRENSGGAGRITIRQGVNANLANGVLRSNQRDIKYLDELAQPFFKHNQRVEIYSRNRKMIIRNNDLSVSMLEFD